MSRHLAKLETLFHKLEARYGADDEAVQQLGQQLKVLEMLELNQKEFLRQPVRERPDPSPRLL